MHAADEKRVQITSKPLDKNLWAYKSQLDYYLFQAKKEGKSEFVIADLSASDEAKGVSQSVTALVDLENNWVYGLRFELKSNTSSAVGHYLLPDLS